MESSNRDTRDWAALIRASAELVRAAASLVMSLALLVFALSATHAPTPAPLGGIEWLGRFLV